MPSKLFNSPNVDFSQHKLLDEQLKSSFNEIRDLKTALDEHASVVIADPQGMITYVNDRFCAISQYSREELLGQDFRIINSGLHSEDFLRDLWTTIATGKVWKGDIRDKAKDGSFYWMDTTIVPFLNADGKPYQYVAIRADITERKELFVKERQSHEALEAANKELAFQIAEKGKRAAELTAIVEERMAANKEFAFQVEEKRKLAEELALIVEERRGAHKELAFQVEEKRKRADELTEIVEERMAADKELAFQVEEKKKRANELAAIVEERMAAKKELAFQVEEKRKRADELAVIIEERMAAHKELAIQVEEKRKRAEELAVIVEERTTAKKELAFQVEVKRKRGDELAAIVEFSEDAIIGKDLNGIITSWNTGAEKIFGYTAGEMAGASIRRLIPADRQEEENLILEKIKGGKSMKPFETLRYTKDGRLIDVSVTVSPIKDAMGKVVGVSKVARDITERVRINRALEAANKEVAFQVGEKGKRADELAVIVEERTAADVELAFQVEEKGKRADELAVIVEERTVANHELAFQVGEKGKRADELAVIVEERTAADVELAFQVEEKGKRADELALIDEERTAANKELAFQVKEKGKRADELAVIVEERTAADVELAFQVEEKGKRADELALIVEERTVANKELAFQVKEKGKRADELAVIVEERTVANKELAFQVKEKGKRADELAVIVEERTVANKELAFQVKEKGKRADELAVIVEERTVANKELAFQVKEKGKRADELVLINAELTRSSEALERSNVDLAQFAYIASHDLQTPLRNISGFVQLLEHNYAEALDDKARDWIRRTVQASEQMHRLIRDVLEYSRVDSRARPFEPVALREVFNDAVGLLEASIRDAGGEVTCDELPTVMGDRSQLVQLLQNLIGNGLKYHGQKPPQVHVSAQHEGNEWTISIRDNGIGIAPKHYERIFEIFKRLHNQQEYPGTGIGLAVCRRVVHRHGGKIWVNSESDQGSTFSFTIPLETVDKL